MPTTFIDYAIAIGVLILGFGATVGYVTGFSTAAQTDVRNAALESYALSLFGLVDREYAFNDSISGFGLAAHVTAHVPPVEITIINDSTLQSLASAAYSTIKENFEFRIRIYAKDNLTLFTYGSVPPIGNVISLKRPVLYTSGAKIESGSFVVEVW